MSRLIAILTVLLPSLLMSSITAGQTSVVGRSLFYNNSAFDRESDYEAIAVDKVALMTGETATFANYSSYSKGINGIFIDIENLPDTDIGVHDFEFKAGRHGQVNSWNFPVPLPEISVNELADSNVHRISLIWPDGAIRNVWLQVRLRGGKDLGLLNNDVFFFGNVVAETGDQADNAQVAKMDCQLTVQNQLDQGAAITNLYDFDRNGAVSIEDVNICRNSQVDARSALPLITPVFSELRNRLRQIGLAMLNHESAFQEFPAQNFNPGGAEPNLSWRVSLLPFLGFDDLYNQFNLDEPWDHPDNLLLLGQMPEVFQHPDFDSNSGPNQKFKTVFQVVVGDRTAFRPGQQSSLGNFIDGTQYSALVVESNVSEAVFWTQPEDITFDESNPFNGVDEHTDGFHICFADGSVNWIPRNTTASNLANILEIFDGQVVDFTDIAPFFMPRNRLRQIALAALNYEASFACFPNQAIVHEESPLLSWRVAILPFIEQGILYDMFRMDEAWDSPHNRALIPLMPRDFAAINVPHGKTNLLVPLSESPVFPFGSECLGFSDIIDGVSNTLMVLLANADQAVEWTRPDDLPFDIDDPLRGLGEFGVIDFARCDGSATSVDADIDPDIFRSLVIIDDGM